MVSLPTSNTAKLLIQMYFVRVFDPLALVA